MQGSGIAPTALVIGGSGFIGTALTATLERRGFIVSAPSRRAFDLLNPHKLTPDPTVIFICGAISKFIECERNPLSYRINVDGPLKVAELHTASAIVYLSSEAVEQALHTAYGMQKALAEISLQPFDTRILRLSKVTPETLFDCCDAIANLADEDRGLYHWNGNEPGLLDTED